MSFKQWSSAQTAANEDKPADDTKAAPETDQPAAEPAEKPAEVAPAPKS